MDRICFILQENLELERGKLELVGKQLSLENQLVLAREELERQRQCAAELVRQLDVAVLREQEHQRNLEASSAQESQQLQSLQAQLQLRVVAAEKKLQRYKRKSACVSVARAKLEELRADLDARLRIAEDSLNSRVEACHRRESECFSRMNDLDVREAAIMLRESHRRVPLVRRLPLLDMVTFLKSLFSHANQVQSGTISVAFFESPTTCSCNSERELMDRQHEVLSDRETMLGAREKVQFFVCHSTRALSVLTGVG